MSAHQHHNNRFTDLLLSHLEAQGKTTSVTSDALDCARWLVRESDFSESETATPADKLAEQIAQAGYYTPSVADTDDDNDYDDGNWFSRLPPERQQHIDRLIDEWNMSRRKR